MSSAGDRSSSSSSSSHIRRHQQPDDGGASQRAEATQPLEQSDDSDRADATAAHASSTDPSASHQQLEPQSLHSGEVKPLPEQMRVRPRLSSQIGHLAVVELQLVMQWLDTKSRLVAARCSRRLLQAADHPFAWSGAKPLIIISRHHARPGTLVIRSLVRHAPIALTLDSEVSPSEVALIPRLRELHVWKEGLASQLLELPALQGLQTLRLPYHQSGSDLQRLTFLPRLHTLHLYAWTSDDWSWLPAMPALTDLCLSNLPSSFSAVHEAIGQCERLHSLQLLAPIFEPGTFVRFCSTAAMTRLQHLELHYLAGAAELSADEWRAGWSALSQLESLRLENAEGVDRLLPHLAHAPALRTLRIPLWPSSDPKPPNHPSAAGVRQLLSAAPRLQVRLPMAATLETWHNAVVCHPPGGDTAQQREAVEEQWHELQRMAEEMERVAVVDNEQPLSFDRDPASTASTPSKAAISLSLRTSSLRPLPLLRPMLALPPRLMHP